MVMDFKPDKPIYQQLIDKVSSEIIRGERNAGDKLPSVRELAVETGVNANTMQRVYREMEQQGIVETKRGQGTFVTENLERLQELRTEMKQLYIEAFVQDMSELGFTLDEMVDGLVHYQGEREGKNDYTE
ncbi:putative HTH-type transcriptional regulator YhcF [Thalassobacillus devorans]|uniref:HTH-type transcriptional regulator YhcF n=1 Tax=Thalassobacillus devorans TaxID=279813 RepID=A0ABQ1NMR2_9BACI|nr:GntR family transcriptional regulator [Thalassobacillus devorans]NIK29121.1 GntR family transcriptional regulator [Thalassobacillus devorans]GGC81000.1 putative HTH-type transcriptional regulator YhcF [Thalassobacillus devorans]